MPKPSKRVTSFSTLGVGILAIAAVVLTQQSSAVEVFSTSTAVYTGGPANPTDAEMDALSQAYLNGTSLPPGYSLESEGADVTATLSGYTLSNGDKQLSIRLIDDIEDADWVDLYVEGQLAFHADRTSGAIVDRFGLGKAVASLSAWIGPPVAGKTFRLEWDGDAGPGFWEWTAQ